LATGNEVNKGSTVWDFLKAIGYVWGCGGVLQMVGKYVHRKPIQRGDLLHVILPLVGAGIINKLREAVLGRRGYIESFNGKLRDELLNSSTKKFLSN